MMNDKEGPLTEDELIERLPGMVATVTGGSSTRSGFFRSAPVYVWSPASRRLRPGQRRRRDRHGIAVAMPFGTTTRAWPTMPWASCSRSAAPDPGVVAAGRWGGPSRPWAVHWHRRPRPDRQGGGAPLPRLRHALLATDVPPDAFAAANGIEVVAADDAAAPADFVSLHVPLASATRNLIGGTTGVDETWPF